MYTKQPSAALTPLPAMTIPYDFTIADSRTKTRLVQGRNKEEPEVLDAGCVTIIKCGEFVYGS